MPAPLPRSPLYNSPVMSLLDPVIAGLFKDESDRLAEELKALVVENHRLGGTEHVFIHRGEILSHLKPVETRAMPKDLVVPALMDRADNWIRLRDKLEDDTNRLRQALTVVLPRCRSKQDVRDVLPETLVAMVPEFRGIARQGAEGFLLDEHPRLKSQYGRVAGIVDYYIANRLLY